MANGTQRSLSKFLLVTLGALNPLKKMTQAVQIPKMVILYLHLYQTVN